MASLPRSVCRGREAGWGTPIRQVTCSQAGTHLVEVKKETGASATAKLSTKARKIIHLRVSLQAPIRTAGRP
jgi:hypothetical protein